MSPRSSDDFQKQFNPPTDSLERQQYRIDGILRNIGEGRKLNQDLIYKPNDFSRFITPEPLMEQPTKKLIHWYSFWFGFMIGFFGIWWLVNIVEIVINSLKTL